jgi:hypothetical protein
VFTICFAFQLASCTSLQLLAWHFHTPIPTRTRNTCSERRTNRYVRREVHLKELLDEFKFFPGLAVHWVFVGPSGHDARPAAGGVLRGYGRCACAADVTVKTIVNSFYAANIARHPHNIEFRCADAMVAALFLAKRGRCVVGPLTMAAGRGRKPRLSHGQALRDALSAQ